MLQLKNEIYRFRTYLGDSSKYQAPGKYPIIFADPPYNLSRNYGPECLDDLPQSDYNAFTFSWMQLAARSLAPNGTLWVVINSDQLFSVLYAAATFGLTRPNTSAPFSHCIWHYRFGQHTHHNFIPSHAHILRFSNGTPTFNPEAILEPSDRAAIYGDSRTLNKASGKPGQRVPFTVWQNGEYASVPDAALSLWQGTGLHRITGNHPERSKPHDNQLPVALVTRCLQASTPINGSPLSVLDPFLGSGTTAVAALRLGHSFTGIELSEDIHRDALVRIRRDCPGAFV